MTEGRRGRRTVPGHSADPGVGAAIKLGDPLLAERLKQGPELSRAFMINYNLYRHYFPLMAMGRWRALVR